MENTVWKDTSADKEYTQYHKMQGILKEQLDKAEPVCEKLDMKESKQQIIQTRHAMEKHRFCIGVLGEFRRGKSMIINSLLGETVLPEDIVPCTATMNRVTWGETKSAELLMMDGTVKQIPYEQLKEYVTKITWESEQRAAEVDSAIVYYPCSFCQNGVDIIDTPGLNDDERMTVITENVVPKLDAIVMVLIKDSPFSQSEADFVRRKLMTSDAGRMIFVINKIDQVPSDQQERLVEHVRGRIKSGVLQRTREVYGEGSPEAEEVRKKLQDIVVLPYSALNALEGKRLLKNGKEAEGSILLEKSGYKALEEALTRMLVIERGKLELARPFNLLQRTMSAASQDISTRMSALDLDQETFEREKKAAMDTIQKQRAAKEEEKSKLSIAKGRMSMELEAETRLFYDELHRKMDSVVDRGINERNVNQNARELTKKIGGLIAGCMEDEISCFGERSLSRISKMIGTEMEKTAVALENLERAKNGIQERIVNVSPSSGILAGTVIDTVTDFAGLYGLGGFISGWRTAGWKGALLGGTTGGGAMVVTTILMGTLGISGLPLLVGGCLIGAVVGKIVPSKVFKNEKEKRDAEKVRREIKKLNGKSIEEMKKKGELEKWAKNTLEKQMNFVIERLETEFEKRLKEIERMMDSIGEQIHASREAQERLREEYQKLLYTCNEILNDAKEVDSYISAAS